MIDNVARGMSANKIKTLVYTCIANGVTNIPHNFSNYNVATDLLIVVDPFYNDKFVLGNQYTENANLISIDLTTGLNIGDQIEFTLFRGAKI